MVKREETGFPFTYDEASDVPLWVQLARRLAYLIESGHYQAGDKLPTVRALASELSINYNTVNKAYLALASDGYIESTRGRGAFVRKLDAQAGSDDLQTAESLMEECIDGCHELGLSYDDINQRMSRLLRARKREAGELAGDASEGRIVEVDINGSKRKARTGA